MEEAVKFYTEYCCKWRPKMETGQKIGTLDGVYRRMVIEVMEEAKACASFNCSEFPYDEPGRGELPVSLR